MMRAREHPARAAILAMGLFASRAAGQDSIAVRDDYRPVAERLQRFVTHEMADKDLPAVWLVLVDDSAIVWARGFGRAYPRDSVSATAQTVVRAAAAAPLLTDMALMRLVARGVLDLDAPLTRNLPNFHPIDPSGGVITLRQLLTHRSGLVREPPVGSYFDSAPPPLATIVASLNATTLRSPPGARYRYSSAGLQVVGRVLEVAAGAPFPRYMRDSVLVPLGMTSSAFFDAPPELASRLAEGTMWASDGRRFAAPTFRREAPGGGLYTTALDLGRFLAALWVDSAPMLRRPILEAMWRPQSPDTGAAGAIGLGFLVSRLDGHRRVGRDGSIYGFASTLSALPDERLGVAVVTNLDAATAVTGRLATAALRAMVARREGEPLPEPRLTARLRAPLVHRAAGHYANGRQSVDLEERGGELLAVRDGGAVAHRIRALPGSDSLTVDDVLDFGGTVILQDDRVTLDGETFRRTAPPRPKDPPARWAGLLGEYGWGYATQYVFERDGRLHALIDWHEEDALDRESDTVFVFPAGSRFGGERLVFTAGAAVAGGVRFARRHVGPERGAQLRVRPLHPVADLLAAARTAATPAESGSFRTPDLVDLAGLDAGIRFDIRYATTNNFLGSVFYTTAHAFLQRPAAEALRAVARRLRPLGYGLLVHDAYRPWYVTKTFWDATPPAERWMVANPAAGSRHNRGCAVDLTLYDLHTGQPLDMGGTYDEATQRSFPDYPVATSLARWNRELLRRVMEDAGFTRLSDEWWHFDFRDWRKYPILNVPFEELPWAKPR